jgi:signal transduction histidine kinase
VLRHADASIVEAEIEYGADNLRVRIRDDGNGADGALLRDGANSGHFGLQGIRARGISVQALPFGAAKTVESRSK